MAYSEEAKSSPVHCRVMVYQYTLFCLFCCMLLYVRSEKCVRMTDARSSRMNAMDPSKTPGNSPLEILHKTMTPLFSALLCPALLDTFRVPYHSYIYPCCELVPYVFQDST